MKDERLWKVFVRKPLRWFLRRFLPPDNAEAILGEIEALISAAQAK